MTKIEDYIKRGMSAKEISVEFYNYCNNTNNEDCPYISTSNVKLIDFLMSEAPHEKTLKELFFEMFPNAPKSSDDVPRCCPSSLGWGHNCEGDGICTECWNRKCKDVLGDEEG